VNSLRLLNKTIVQFSAPSYKPDCRKRRKPGRDVFLFHAENSLRRKKTFRKQKSSERKVTLGPSTGCAGKYRQNQSLQASGQGGISKYSTARVVIQGNTDIFSDAAAKTLYVRDFKDFSGFL
jgi:hypothetical protein